MAFKLRNIKTTNARVRLIPQNGATANITNTDNPTLMKDDEDVIFCLSGIGDGFEMRVEKDKTDYLDNLIFRIDFYDPSLIPQGTELTIWGEEQKIHSESYPFDNGSLVFDILPLIKESYTYGDDNYLIEVEFVDTKGTLRRSTHLIAMEYQQEGKVRVVGPGTFNFVVDYLYYLGVGGPFQSKIKIKLDDNVVDELINLRKSQTLTFTVPDGEHYITYASQPGMIADIAMPVDSSNPAKITEIINFGDGFDNIRFTNQDLLTKVPSVLNKSIVDLSRMFLGCSLLNDPVIGFWDTSDVVYASATFSRCINLNIPLYWDTSSMLNMIGFLFRASSFKQDLSNFCVGLIFEEPEDFAINTPMTSDLKPKWGTCPSKVRDWEVINGSVDSDKTLLTSSGQMITLSNGVPAYITGAKIKLDQSNIKLAGILGIPYKYSTDKFKVVVGISNTDVPLIDWLNKPNEGSVYITTSEDFQNLQFFQIVNDELNSENFIPKNISNTYSNSNTRNIFVKSRHNVIKWGGLGAVTSMAYYETQDRYRQRPIYLTNKDVYFYVMMVSSDSKQNVLKISAQ